MIEAIYLAGIVAAVLINITALTLLVRNCLPYPATARATGILVFCLALFCLEHFVGLGDLTPISLPVTGLSLLLIWWRRARFLDRGFKASEIVFLCALAYGAIWRLSFPEVLEDNDRLTDFHFVANYFSGERLPPVDAWLPYQRLDYYYAFQHYAAALLGRIFGLGPGVSFNVAAVILSGLVITLAWEFLAVLGVRFRLKLLAIAALAIGGTGISPLLHVITTGSSAPFLSYVSAVDALVYNSKLLGLFNASSASDIWRAVFGETSLSVRLPIETFGYQYAIGGYHAVLSGFLLLFLALASIAAVPQAEKPVRTRLEFVLGLTVPLTLCANAWLLPLQAALVGAWKLWDWRRTRRFNLFGLAAGAGVGLFLLLPFLAGLGAGTNFMQLQFVAWQDHAPVAQFLIVWWPLLVLAIAAPLLGLTRSPVGFFAALFLSLLAFTEIVNAFDGAYRDDFIRFNPALKWWGWIFTGGVFSISAYLLASNRRAARVTAGIVLTLISVFAVDAGRYLIFRSHDYAGKLDGTGYYVQDPANARMLSSLTQAPRDIVLEPIYDVFPLDTGIYGSFALKPSVVGIPWALESWKKGMTELPGLIAEIKSFYAGTHKQAARFLIDHDVRYVVWSVRESTDLATWQAIAPAIEAEYRWMEFSATPNRHIGLWIRR